MTILFDITSLTGSLESYFKNKSTYIYGGKVESLLLKPLRKLALKIVF